MFGASDLQYKLENISIWFQGGVRRGFLIFGLVGLAICIPIYFLTTFLSGVWYSSSINPAGLNEGVYFIKKDIVENQIIVSSAQVVELSDNTNELYLSINNKTNPEIGYYPYDYDLIVSDQNGAIIDSSKQSNYLLPGEIKYIVYRSRDGRGKNLTLKQSNTSKKVFYNPASKKYKKPNISITNTRFETRYATDILYVYFTIINKDLQDVNQVDLTYSLRDSRESVVGIGDFKVLQLKAGEQRDIVVPYTNPKTREPKFLNVDWYVNFLAEYN